MFIENLNRYLKEVGWQRKDLAAATGLWAESISRWNQTDRFRPGRESLEKIKTALNAELERQGKPFRVTIDSLLAET